MYPENFIKPIAMVSGIDADRSDGGEKTAPNFLPDDLVKAEREYIKGWRTRTSRSLESPLNGLAFSGGGIRSATFCLGVMQALARSNLLKHFDYLSTVSGGGYIGSSLTWFLSRKNGDDALGLGKDFPFGTDDPKKTDQRIDNQRQNAILRFFREHGNYLTPGRCINSLSLISVVLRGILLNLFVWVPILTLVMAILLSYGHHWPSLMKMIMAFGTPLNLGDITKIHIKDFPAFKVSCDISVAVALLFITSSVLYSLVTWLGRGEPGGRRNLMRAIGVILIFLFGYAMVRPEARTLYYVLKGPLWLLITVAILFMVIMLWDWLFGDRSTDWRYRGRRIFECLSGWCLGLFAVFLIVGTLPLASAEIHKWVDVAGGPLAAFSGAVAGIWGFVRSGRDEKNGIPLDIIAPIGAILILYGFLLMSFDVAFFILSAGSGAENERVSFPFIDVELSKSTLVHGSFVGTLLVSFITGRFVNLNYISVHRYYRDRIMETFMPDVDKALKGETGSASGADKCRLASLGDIDALEVRSPYHIINTNVVLVNSKDRTRRVRGGDNFILSPLYCGSNATGWERTRRFMGGGMTLASAIAISGAAANPNAGVGGAGPTRNPVLSILMALLNLRLGYWARNPNQRWGFLNAPNHFRPGLYEILNKGFDENRWFLQLSDGGHFENLGLYELIRRRCRVIVICDAGADPDFSFDDLQVALRRIRADFGARITFDNANNPERVIPNIDAGYPRGVKKAIKGHIKGTIRYADGNLGTLLYLKTTIIDGLSVETLGYAGANKDFPDQTTLDQFFDEDQFEAYRELGYRIASQMIDDERPDALLSWATAT